jgi:hypothetical protein
MRCTGEITSTPQHHLLGQSVEGTSGDFTGRSSHHDQPEPLLISGDVPIIMIDRAVLRALFAEVVGSKMTDDAEQSALIQIERARLRVMLGFTRSSMTTIG